ncbi:Starch-binding associating with outer membrane [Chitinophaga jiangningensis]|uniref:Starch-binding associating with outer membrane n=1 Tax=Chitinophaga jiangningensis TaxID=1419482 RepID=A0A1M7DXU7_9BACT|nr:RagB/SusD family nutrient uptake outer membrane protein [Chitinophaga jiangningensis]SHL84341.1 Starch-binding associating with outer membrane [Chitinophaga jiangningensis]
MRNIFKYQYKRYVGLALAAGIVAGLTSCSKFTELKPKNQVDENVVFTDSSYIELALNGVYNAATVGSYNDTYSGRGYPFGAAAIEQDEMRGEDMVNLATFYEITYKAQYSTTSANNVAMWVNLYSLINQANVFIEGIQAAAAKGIISAGKELQLEGEARFLRALAHHELLIHFCRPYADGNGAKAGVPYRTLATNTVDKIQKNLSMPRGTVAEDYTQILTDLDFAEKNLSATSRAFSKATQGAAIALKTRIKLHMQDYAGVIAEAAKLGADKPAPTSSINSYALAADVTAPFASYGNNNNTESVFSIANSVAANGDVNGALAPMFGPTSTSGRGLVGMSPNLYNAKFFAADDDRRKLMIRQTGAADVAKYVFSAKYTDYANRSDWAPILRYAEVLLNAAEAYSRTGNNVQAYNLLKVVHNRSNAKADQTSHLPDVMPGTITDLTLAILNERRVEFFAEGRRWPDLHRLALDAKYGKGGIPAKVDPAALKIDGSDYDVNKTTPVATGIAAIEYSDYRFLWPFPATETASNPTLKAAQNPGY